MTMPEEAAVTITKEQLAILQEVAFAISTEDADPVWAASEPGDGPAYETAAGKKFSLRPIVSLEAFESFMSALSDIEDQFFGLIK